jgi:transposase
MAGTREAPKCPSVFSTSTPVCLPARLPLTSNGTTAGSRAEEPNRGWRVTGLAMGTPSAMARCTAHCWSRRMVDALLYPAGTGCQWRHLPRSFGPWGAIWQQFRRWRDAGLWEQALTVLCREARHHAGRGGEPSMLMLDCQTVKGGRAGPGFHEAGGKYGHTIGAKRTMLVDHLGFPVAARVDSARLQDKTSVAQHRPARASHGGGRFGRSGLHVHVPVRTHLWRHSEGDHR